MALNVAVYVIEDDEKDRDEADSVDFRDVGNRRSYSTKFDHFENGAALIRAAFQSEK